MTDRSNVSESAPRHPRYHGAHVLRACCLCAASALLLLGTGCARRYAMTLGNSDVIYTQGKPRLNERGWYVFKDAQGREHQINSMRVRSIEPR